MVNPPAVYTLHSIYSGLHLVDMHVLHCRSSNNKYLRESLHGRQYILNGPVLQTLLKNDEAVGFVCLKNNTRIFFL